MLGESAEQGGFRSRSPARGVGRVPSPNPSLSMGAYPRGIAVSPDASTAYVAIMGGDDVVKVNLATLSEEGSFVVGENPRHLVMDPAGRYLYASLNAPGQVVKVDLTKRPGGGVGSYRRGLPVAGHLYRRDGSVCRQLRVEHDYKTPGQRSLGAPDDSTGVNPIGITYDATTGNVWVAVYTGQILVFADR
jgi:DNA-binding beta-propeller fold protein YncE